MDHELEMGHPTHGQVHASVVMAALALLTGSQAVGVVRADAPFRVDEPGARAALLEAATAIQTEVSLSIFSSDPLIAEASKQLGELIGVGTEDERLDRAIIETDRIIQEWISLIAGRGKELDEIAEWILQHGEISLEEIAKRLHISESQS